MALSLIAVCFKGWAWRFSEENNTFLRYMENENSFRSIVGLELGLRGLIVQRATANQFHQLVFRERNKQYWIFGRFVYIEIYGVLLQETGPKKTDLA